MLRDRVIKFRVFNTLTNEWVHGPKEEVNLFGEMILMGGFCDGVSLMDLNHVHALQYIGLKDKNDVEVYEGDLVIYEGGIYQVIYCDAKACYSLKGAGAGGLGRWMDIMADIMGNSFPVDKFEVVGNIYDNEVLLDTDATIKLVERKHGQIFTDKA